MSFCISSEMYLGTPMNPLRVSRRQLMRGCAAGSVAAWQLRARLQMSAAAGQWQPIVAAGPHFLPKARQLLIVFLTGGVSHLDTFDPKPRLTRDHGKIVDGPGLRDS